MGAPQYEQAGADIGGTGTTNTIPRWTGPSTLGDSVISQDNGTNRLLIAGGTAVAAANGTNITIQAQNGGTGNTNGGIIDLVVGLRSGSGTRGYARIDGGLGNDVDLYLGGGTGPTVPYGVGQRAYSGQSHVCVYANAGYGAARASLGMVSGGVYTPALSADPSGNVGIGTASPVARMDVSGVPTTSTPIARFAGNNGGGTIQNLANLAIYGNLSGGFVETTLVYGNTVNSYLAIGHHNGTSYTERARIDLNGNIYGTSGTTGMTNGFFYIPAAAGAPTGTPTAVSGRVPMYYDTTNNQFYVYNGAWKKVTLA